MRHIIVATDDSRAGRAAVLTAARLGQICRARVTALSVANPGESRSASENLRALVNAALDPLPYRLDMEVAVAVGIPGVEIGRYAETEGADLIVLGRKPRTELERLLIGDTADSVARRSRTPCLFVSDAGQEFHQFLVSLDGTDRGMTVLIAALDFARAVGATLRIVSVEPLEDSNHVAPDLVTGRSARLMAAVEELIASTDLELRREAGKRALAPPQVAIRRGAIVEQVLNESEASGADVLVVGYHRGGPAGSIDVGSVGRRLAHEARRAVLTIPL